ncbi:MAG: DoxX family membrane protein [Candidatus Dormibacteraeota bacterium]|nr:DoxX family membrane protein [Candidatus Dormibacteraeota bacterium]
MPTTLDRPTLSPIEVEKLAPAAFPPNGGPRSVPSAPVVEQSQALSPLARRLGMYGLLGLRLAIGIEFLWAFLDKTFGFGYATPAARAWVNGGSPTKGFLSHTNVGPFQGLYHAIAGTAIVDWLFMLGLLAVGVALILGVALRPAAAAAAAMLVLMYAASWPFATLAAGVPTGSTNPFIDAHVIDLMAVITIGTLAALSVGVVSRRWSALSFVRSHAWLR